MSMAMLPRWCREAITGPIDGERPWAKSLDRLAPRQRRVCPFAAQTGFAALATKRSAARSGGRSLASNSVPPSGRLQAAMPSFWFPGSAGRWPRAMAQAGILGSIARIGLRCRSSSDAALQEGGNVRLAMDPTGRGRRLTSGPAGPLMRRLYVAFTGDGYHRGDVSMKPGQVSAVWRRNG